jgi:hypothetical protein
VYKKINNYIGKKLSSGLATMETFYIVAFLVLFPLLFDHPKSFIGWVSYSSTAVLQAVALPLLGYTTRIGENRQVKLLKETHDTVMKEMTKLNRMSTEIHKLIKKGDGEHDE